MRNWKTVLIFVLIFALLGGAYFFLQHYTPSSPSSAPTPTPQIPLLSMDSNLICQIDIENTTGSFGFVKGEAGWNVKNAPGIALTPGRVETLCFSAATLSADAQISAEAEDLSAFGLEKPQATISLLSCDGGTAIFHIGNLTPTGDGYYARLAESRAVYTLSASTAAQFCSPLRDFRVMTISALHTADIRSISIQKKDSLFRISYVAPSDVDSPGAVSTWLIESPIKRDADNKLVQERLLQPLSSITAADIAADEPKDLSAFGFTGDTVTILTETETLQFSVGTKDGAWYILPKGSETVYFMGNTPLSFMEVTPFDVLEKMTNVLSIETVDTIAVSFPEATITLKVTHAGSEMQFFVNGTPASEDAFKAMYVELSALSVDGMLQTPLSGTAAPVGTIVYTLTDKSAITLAYTPYDDFNYAVSENGESTFYIKKTKLSALCQKLLTFAKNPQG